MQWRQISRRGREGGYGGGVLANRKYSNRAGRKGRGSNLTDHSFNSGENTVMARRQTVTDTGGSRSRRGRKTEELEEEEGGGKKKTGRSTRPPCC